MVLKPVLDKSRAVEWHIVPDDNVLHLVHLVNGSDDVVQSVQKCENVRCVVRAHIGMTEEDPILCNGSTKGDVTPTLPWDIDYSPVANDISASPSCLSLNPASSMYMCSCRISSASICKTLWNTVKEKIAKFRMDLVYGQCTCTKVMCAVCNITVLKWTKHTSTYSCRSLLTLSEFRSKGTR